MKTQYHETTVERGGNEVAVLVEYTYYPEVPATRDDPGEDASVEVEQVWRRGEDGQVGAEVNDLTDEEIKTIEGEIFGIIGEYV